MADEAVKAKTCRGWETKPLMEGDELAMIYFQSERLVVASSKLPPGGRSNRDPGHPGAHEVAYCISGEAVIEIGDREGEFVRLQAGDAVLIYEGVPHTAYNPTDELAELLWCAAPNLGRPLVHDG